MKEVIENLFFPYWDGKGKGWGWTLLLPHHGVGSSDP